MKILLIEDERPAALQLQKLLAKAAPEAQVLSTIDSVEDSVAWLQENSAPDLIFMDIQLADGLSFDIFRQMEVSAPVIFTTAFDQYAVQAFKVNSIDYLLKPVQPEELQAALQKFRERQPQSPPLSPELLQQLLRSVQQPQYKERFLVKSGQSLLYIPVEEAAYFYAEDGLNFLLTENKKRYPIDYTLDQLESELDPGRFHRISRKFIVGLPAIHKIHPYFNHRLKLDLRPPFEGEVIVSRDRVSEFKAWLDR